MKQIVAALLGVGLLALSPLVSAQTATPPAAMDFSTLDTNGDGSISETELNANAEVRGRFSNMDSNRDGRVDNAEMGTFQRNNPGAGRATSNSNSAPNRSAPQTGRDTGVTNRGISESGGTAGTPGATSSGSGGVGPGSTGSGATNPGSTNPGNAPQTGGRNTR